MSKLFGGSFRSNAVLYILAVLVTRTASLVMLPVNTRYLTPVDYGVVQMLAMLADITSILLTAGMNSGVQRFYFKAESDGQRLLVVSTAFFLEVGLAFVGTLCLLAGASPVAAGLLGDAAYAPLVRIVAVDFTLGILPAVPLLLMQTEQRAMAFVGATVSRVVLQVSLNLLFVVGLGWGVRGILTSTLIANAVVGSVLAFLLLRRTGIRIDREVLTALRRFGIPNQISFAGAFINTFGDRFFLQASAGLAAVGLYGMAYQFGFLLAQVASAPFLQAWSPVRYRLLSEPRSVRDAAITQSFFYFNSVLISCAVLMGVFIEPTLFVLTAPAFHSAASIVPVILVAYVIQSWTDVVRFGIDVAEKTRYHAYAIWASVAMTLTSYALLIPPFGVYGAAVATILGFLVRFWLSNVWGQRFDPVVYGWARVLRMAAVGSAATAAYYLLAPDGFVRQVAVASLCFAGYLAALLFAIAHPHERAAFVSVLGAPRRALATLAQGASGKNT